MNFFEWLIKPASTFVVLAMGLIILIVILVKKK